MEERPQPRLRLRGGFGFPNIEKIGKENIMRRTIIVLAIFIFSTAVESRAQTLNVAQQGDKAVLFNFVGLSNLGLDGYNGGIGGKYFISDGMAVRAMLLFSIDNNTSNSIPQTSSNSFDFGIQGGLEYHLPLASRISPYVGGLLSFGTNANTTNPGANKNSSTSFGLGAVGGIEYFFNSNISLSAEYQFGFTSTNNSTSGAPGNNRFQLGFQTAGLTLAAYF